MIETGQQFPENVRHSSFPVADHYEKPSRKLAYSLWHIISGVLISLTVAGTGIRVACRQSADVCTAYYGFKPAVYHRLQPVVFVTWQRGIFCDSLSVASFHPPLK